MRQGWRRGAKRHCFNRTHLQFSFRANVSSMAGNISASKGGHGRAREGGAERSRDFIEQIPALNLTCDLFVQTVA